MNKRQSKKIIQRLVFFRNWQSNYQPYSIPQQIIAFIRLGFRKNEIGDLLHYKVPIRYRLYHPRRIALAMLQEKLQPTNAKEYDACMCILRGERI